MSWNLPPGCTPYDVEEAAGAFDDEIDDQIEDELDQDEDEEATHGMAG